jgi:hypothetical protein
MHKSCIMLCSIILLNTAGAALAESPAVPSPDRPEVRDGIAHLPHVEIDARNRQVRVECEVIRVEMLLEFFCVVAGGPEHETVLRTQAKASHVHLGLLMLGLKPGSPVRFSPAADRWLPPHGPPLHISVRYEREGETITVPASRWMRNAETKEPMPQTTWIFTGSRVMEDGNYAADITGYVVSVVNFDLTVIDVPELRSSSNELLEWETNPETVPEAGTKVWMILEPAGEAEVDPPAEQAQVGETVVRLLADGRIEVEAVPVELERLTEHLRQMHEERPIRVRLLAETGAGEQLQRRVTEAITEAGVPMAYTQPGAATENRAADAPLDERRLAELRERWSQAVAPHRPALREAAQTHYEVLAELRQEQQRLIDAADRIQRLIEQIEREYRDMTTPRPQPLPPD